jgi:hypothetical protein
MHLAVEMSLPYDLEYDILHYSGTCTCRFYVQQLMLNSLKSVRSNSLFAFLTFWEIRKCLHCQFYND